MKSWKGSVFLACLLAALPLACGGEDAWVCDSACALDAGPGEVPQGMEIQYEAYATGDGVFSEVQYLDNSEPEQAWRTVEQGSIFVPWVWTGTFQGGMQVRIKGKGQLENGLLRVGFFQRNDPDAFSGGDMCEWVCSMFR